MTDTLSFCGREEAITRMNRFGCEGRPFFFLIDYTAEKCLVEEPHRLPSAELLFAFPGATNVPQGMSATSRPRFFLLGASSDEFLRSTVADSTSYTVTCMAAIPSW